MRVLFMGTPPIAAASLKALLESNHQVCAVVTQPDRPKGRSRKKLVPSPVKEVAVAAGLVGYIGYILVAMSVPPTGSVGRIIEQGMAGHWVAPLISLLCAILGMVTWYLKPGRVFWAEAGRRKVDIEEE